MNNKLNDLQLMIMPCSPEIPEECKEYYLDAYQLWHGVWSKTLEELDGVKKLYSNDFTRHHFLSAIFLNKKAISLICYSQVDMSMEVSHEDSWFKAWPKNLLHEQKKRHGLGLYATWFCTDPDFRKSNTQFPINISQVIVEVFGKLVVDGGYNAGYGTTRNNRNVGKYSANAGSIVVGESFDHNCNVDLVVYEPNIIKQKQYSYSDEFKYLWERRIDYRRQENGFLQRAA